MRSVFTFIQTGQEQLSFFCLWSLRSRMRPATTSDGTKSRSPNMVCRTWAASRMATVEDLLLPMQQQRALNRRKIFR